MEGYPMKAIYDLGKLRGSHIMVGQSPAVRVVWFMLLLGLAAIFCVSCGAENPQSQPDNLDPESPPPSPRDIPEPLVSQPHKEEPEEPPMSDAIDGKATIVAKKGLSYTVSFVLTNITSKVIVIDLGPQEGIGPDGEEISLGQPGVSMAVFVDGEWWTADNRMALGANWKGIIRIQPGKQFAWTVEFGITKWNEAKMKAGAPAALILHGYRYQPANVSGKLIIPLSKKTDESSEPVPTSVPSE